MREMLCVVFLLSPSPLLRIATTALVGLVGLVDLVDLVDPTTRNHHGLVDSVECLNLIARSLLVTNGMAGGCPWLGKVAFGSLGGMSVAVRVITRFQFFHRECGML